MINFEAVNCVINEDTITGSGVFGLRRQITLLSAQKVYFRVNLTPTEPMRVQIGIVDDGILYMSEKKMHKKGCISVVHTAKKHTVELVLICDTIYKSADVLIENMVVKPLGKSLIPKIVLDRIPYRYSDCKNLCHEEPFTMMSLSSTSKSISADLEKGRKYLVKVYADERTDCGDMWIDCGVDDSNRETEMVKEFVFTGRYPHLRIKATSNKFEYIVDVRVVVIVDAEEIGMEEFRSKLYWR